MVDWVGENHSPPAESVPLNIPVSLSGTEFDSPRLRKLTLIGLRRGIQQRPVTQKSALAEAGTVDNTRYFFVLFFPFPFVFIPPCVFKRSTRVAYSYCVSPDTSYRVVLGPPGGSIIFHHNT